MEPAFWNGREWVQRRDAPTSALWSVSPGSFTTEQLCGRIRLKEAWPETRWPEEIESSVAPRPVVFPSQNVPRMSMDHGMKLVDAWMAERQVRAFDNALQESTRGPSDTNGGIENQIPKEWKEEQDLRSENGFLADWRGQTPLATGVWDDQAHNIASRHGMTPARCISQQEQELACRAAVAKPENNQGATASGSHLQKILNEKASKAAPKSRGIRRNPTASRRADKPVQEIRCSECTESEGKPVTFKCVRSLQRHLTGTKKHNARPILRCSCGTVVVRKDAMHSHRNSCKEGTIVPLEA
ncbi:hypothetical protein BGY98DRAFT_1020055 [Russula aff. rugulosa BPL654]|nr:hypothetical protein BGY98DRAFT_1020055 [Russula aff. rugulosa BPL654]